MKQQLQILQIRYLFLLSLLLGAFSIQTLTAQTAGTNTKTKINVRANYLPQAQYPYLFKTIPLVSDDSPDWVKMMYSTAPNYYEVEAAYNTYYRNHVFEKNTHTQNYRYWSRRIIAEGYLQPDGSIYIPTVEESNAKETFLQQKYERYRKIHGIRNRSGNWTAIGPFETYSANGTTYRSSQTNIYTISQSSSNPNVLYAGTEGGGIFKTTDKGLNWTSVADKLILGGIGAIEVDPSNENIVYMTQGNRLYKTTNGGATWNILQEIDDLNITDISINPDNTNIVLTAGNKGLKRSTDGGSTWTDILTDKCWDIELKTNDPDTVFVAKTNTTSKVTEIWKSTDAGQTFVAKTTGWFMPCNGVAAYTGGARIGVTKADSNRIYVVLLGEEDNACDGGTSDNNYIGIYRSDDAGETWSTPYDGDGDGEPDNEPGGPYGNDHWCLSTFHKYFSSGYNQGFYNLAIDVSDTDEDKFLVGFLNLFMSDDGGVTYTGWGGYECGGCSGSGGGYRHPDIQEIEINGNDVWVCNDGGVDYYDVDFNFVSSRTKGIDGSDFWGFGQGWNDDVLTGGKYHNGNSAHYEGFGVGKFLALDGGESATGYVNQGKNLKVYHSDIDAKKLPLTITGGITTITNYSMFPNESINTNSKSEIVIDPRSWNTLYIGKDNKLWKSTDGGISFDVIATFGSATGNIVLGIEIPRSNPDVIYVVQGISGGGKLWKTTNGGTSWSALTLPATTTEMYISVSTDDENEIFLALDNGGTSLNKIFKSTNGGSTWSNISSPVFDGETPKCIQVQDGTDGGVYVATDGKVYYKNNSINWQQYSDGLPAKVVYEAFLPFYRDGKVRLATSNRGIWESPLYENYSPIAQPMASVTSVFCTRDTVQFEDYSIRKTGATYKWAFSPAPQWVSSTTVRNPQVVFGSVGSYDVALTVTDISGTDTKTVHNMITVAAECEPELVPGNAMVCSSSGDYSNIPNIALSTNSVTFSAWIKPNGSQNNYAGIIFNDGTRAGLNFKSGKLAYHWPNGDYWWNSGLVVPENEWSFVAMVVEPTGVTLYLNGIGATHSFSTGVVSLGTMKIGSFQGRNIRNFIGEIDEVCIYDRSLSESEIRELMHLTKKPLDDPSLIHYYQFNRASGIITDRAGLLHARFSGGATRSTSTAPIGGGISKRMNVSSSGVYSFIGTDLTLDFASGTYPDGDLVVSKLDVAPDQYPGTNPMPPDRYWIIHNYGANSTFTPLNSIKFEGLTNIIISNNGNEYNLHKRSSTADGNTWGQEIDSGDEATPTSLTFSTGNGISGFSQFAIDKAETLPIELLDFTVRRGKGDIAILEWQTAIEINSSHFEVERSSDGEHFVYFRRLDAIGNQVRGADYAIEDRKVFNGMNYYRLKIVDKDGRFSYSPVRSVFIRALPKNVLVYPNPLSGNHRLNFESDFKVDYNIDIYDVNGKQVIHGNIQGGKGQINLKSLPNGTYFYRAVSDKYMQNGVIVLE